MGMQGLSSLFGSRKRREAARPLSYAPRARLQPTPSPDQVLGWLKDGNSQFVAAGAPIAPYNPQEIAQLTKGQTPVAVIVGCSDSRVAPEILFDCRLGDLFVVRGAGASVDETALGSIDYGVSHLHCPVVLVLGHAGCGAVHAAARAVTENVDFDGPLENVVLPILPSVLKAKAAGANDLVNASVREHVTRVVRKLKSFVNFAGPIGAGRLKIVGGYYDLASGRVEFIA
jgi:carbonic anhydrase